MIQGLQHLLAWAYRTRPLDLCYMARPTHAAIPASCHIYIVPLAKWHPVIIDAIAFSVLNWFTTQIR